jgi:hypothetical protein
MLNFSQDILSITDLGDLDRPQETIHTPLAPRILQAHRMGDYTFTLRVDEPDQERIPWDSAARWELRRTRTDAHIEDGDLIDFFAGTPTDKALVHGDHLYIERSIGERRLHIIRWTGEKLLPVGDLPLSERCQLHSSQRFSPALFSLSFKDGLLCTDSNQITLSFLDFRNPAQGFIVLPHAMEKIALHPYGDGDIAISGQMLLPQGGLSPVITLLDRTQSPPTLRILGRFMPSRIPVYLFEDAQSLLLVSAAQGTASPNHHAEIATLRDEQFSTLHSFPSTPEPISQITAQGNQIAILSKTRLMAYRYDAQGLQLQQEIITPLLGYDTYPSCLGYIGGQHSGLSLLDWQGDHLLVSGNIMRTTLLALDLRYPLAEPRFLRALHWQRNPDLPSSIHSVGLPLGNLSFTPKEGWLLAAQHQGILSLPLSP